MPQLPWPANGSLGQARGIGSDGATRLWILTGPCVLTLVATVEYIQTVMLPAGPNPGYPNRAWSRLMESIYLDYNATAPIWPQAAQAMHDVLAAGYVNPASQHAAGRAARKLLADTRDELGSRLGAQTDVIRPDKVVLTSGGTEANNLALFGLSRDQPGQVIVSAVEHPSVSDAADELARSGRIVQRLSVSTAGIVDLEQLERLLAEPTALVSVMWANNETGAIQPVAEIADLCRRHGVPLHVDAVQVAGKLAVDFTALGPTTLAVSAHKFHGPTGCGALIVSRSARELRPVAFGGHQQHGLRPGTEAIAPAVGMLAALRIWDDLRNALAAQMRELRDRFEAGILAGCPDAVINAVQAERLPQTSNVAFPGVDRQQLLIALDMAGVACSTGSACSSGSSEPSPVLVAMGLPESVIEGSLRVSLGPATTAAEVDLAVERILMAVKNLRHRQFA